MNFGDSIQSGFRNYVNFNGRAARSEFWYWTLFTILAGFLIQIIDYFVFGPNAYSIFSIIFNLAVFLPSLAVGVRRLHDLDRTGWWTLLLLTGIGVILLLIWDCLRGTPGPNRFGPDPLARTDHPA